MMIDQNDLPKKHHKLDLANQRLQNKLNHVSDPNSLQSENSPNAKDSNYNNFNQGKLASQVQYAMPADKQILAISSGNSAYHPNQKDSSSPTTMTNLSSVMHTNYSVQNQQQSFFQGQAPVNSKTTTQGFKEAHSTKDAQQENSVDGQKPEQQVLSTGNSAPKLPNTDQMTMKKVPSNQKIVEKSVGRKKQTVHSGAQNSFHNDQTQVNDHYSSKSQSKSHSRGTSQTNRIAGQHPVLPQFVQNPAMAGMSNGFNFHGQYAEQIPSDQFQNFNFAQMNQQPFQFATPQTSQTHQQMSQQQPHQQQQWQQPNSSQQQWQPQPVVHFVAKQQKFYGISPDRAPLIFNQAQASNGFGDKRPYTSSGNVIKNNNRSVNAKVTQTNSAIAALYLGSKAGHTGLNFSHNQQRNASQPSQDVSALGYNAGAQQSTFSQQQIPSKRQVVNINNRVQVANSANNAGRKANNVIVQKENEQLYEEAIKFKQLANQHKDENLKLKTKIKILEAEMGRKERAIEDFYTQNQFITQAQKNQAINGQLAPIAQTTQKYQQETFLVISLKKQVKEIKTELQKKEEELAANRRNIKATRLFEMEQEMNMYKEELNRLRFMLDQNFQQQNQKRLAHHSSLQNPGDKTPMAQGKITASASYGEKRNDVLPYRQQTSQELGQIKKEASEITTQQSNYQQQLQSHIQSINGQSNGFDQTQTSGFNGFTSIGDHRVQDEILSQLQVQINEKDMVIAHLQTQMDELQSNISIMPSSQEQTKDTKDEEKRQRSELSRYKKIVKDKEKEITKFKSECSVFQTKSAQADEEAQKLKQTQATNIKRTKELAQDIKNKSEKLEAMTKDLQAANDNLEKQKNTNKSLSSEVKTLKTKLDEMIKEIEDLKQVKQKSPEKVVEVKKVQQSETAENKEEIQKKIFDLRETCFDELNIICSIVGRKEELDRVDLAHLLKQNQDVSYLEVSPQVQEFLDATTFEELPQYLPRYIQGSEERDRMVMHKLRKIIQNKEMLQILNEKQNDDNLPFDALKELCDKFGHSFTDEHCGFICANFLRKVNQGSVWINFEAFLGALKADKDKPIHKDQTMTVDSEKEPITVEGSVEDSDEKSDKPTKSNKKKEENPFKEEEEKMLKEIKKFESANGKPRKSLDEEQMLDIAESCFIKIAEMLIKQNRGIRTVFGKYAVPEMFPDRTILELLSPLSFLEGVKEIGLDDLQEIEAACLMRVLAKPELENAIILNELVLIMENFGVVDLDEDAEDDYIPDTEADEDAKSQQSMKEIIDTASKKEEDLQKLKEKKSKKRAHNLSNIDEKGIKILRKLARFLLKQFLHPREFFGKAIYKDKITTKKREFILDVIKVKDFYLRMKIASIRKRIAENQSLNDELVLDTKNYNQVFNVKNMVKALEEIAEEEQAVMLKEEAQLREENADLMSVESEGVSAASPLSAGAGGGTKIVQKSPIEGKIEVGKNKKGKKGQSDYYETNIPQNEIMKLGLTKENARTAQARMGGFQNLNTIEEERHETQTSNYYEGSERDDSKLMGSTNLRSSQHADLDEDYKKSANKNDFFNKSLTKEDKMLPLSTRSKEEPANMEAEIAKKKFSHSVADASVRNFRNSQQNSEVFDNGSDHSLNGSPPTKTFQNKAIDDTTA